MRRNTDVNKLREPLFIYIYSLSYVHVLYNRNDIHICNFYQSECPQAAGMGSAGAVFN